jgi:hypothetical protein
MFNYARSNGGYFNQGTIVNDCEIDSTSAISFPNITSSNLVSINTSISNLKLSGLSLANVNSFNSTLPNLKFTNITSSNSLSANGKITNITAGTEIDTTTILKTSYINNGYYKSYVATFTTTTGHSTITISPSAGECYGSVQALAEAQSEFANSGSCSLNFLTGGSSGSFAPIITNYTTASSISVGSPWGNTVTTTTNPSFTLTVPTYSPNGGYYFAFYIQTIGAGGIANIATSAPVVSFNY